MDRNQFIELFNKHFDNNKMYETYKEPLYHFNVDILNFNNRADIQSEIQKHLISFINMVNIKDDQFIEKLNIKIEYDCYFEEEEDSEYCRYNCKFNINHLYDQFVLSSNFSLKPVTLYRLETVENESLYNTGFAATINFNDNQQSPYEDHNLKYIFDNYVHSKDENYKRKWFFAFSNIEKMEEWTNNNLENILNKYNLHIKEITIPCNFVIEGENQTIFQKEQVIHEKIIKYNGLSNNHHKTLKL